MIEEQRLFGEFVTLEVQEFLLSEGSYDGYQSQIELTWQRFIESNPSATRDQKIRVAALKGENKSLVACLSSGIDFSHVLFSEKMRAEQNLPPSPIGMFCVENGVYYTQIPYSNAAAVAGIVLFNPNKSYNLRDQDIRLLFSIRSSQQATSANTLSLIVNGYVEAGVIDDYLFEENLFRETSEEAYMTENEFSKISFIGPALMRGVSCDFVWLLESSLSYEEWEGRWRRNKGQDESAGILALAPGDLDKLFVERDRVKLVAEKGLISAEARNMIKTVGLSLNPLVQSLHQILCANRLSDYLGREPF